MTTREVYEKLNPKIKKMVDEKCDLNKYDGLRFSNLVFSANAYVEGYSKLNYNEFTKGLNPEIKSIFDEVYRIILDNSQKK